MISILSSTVLAAMVSGVITYFSAKKEHRSAYVIKTYDKERNKIMELIKVIPNTTYEELKGYVQEIKTLINPLGMSSKNLYSYDSHIWKIIRIIEKSEEHLEEKKQVLQMYLTILLDKKRGKLEEEFKEKLYDIFTIALYVMSAAFMLVSIVFNGNYVEEAQTGVEKDKMFISLLAVATFFIAATCMFLFFFKIILEQVILKLNFGFPTKYIILAVFTVISVLGNSYFFMELKGCVDDTILVTSAVLQEFGLVFCFWGQTCNLPRENSYLQMIKRIEKEYNERMEKKH